MAETIDSVFRDFNTPGNPGSGEYEPEKPRIRALLRQLQGGAGQSVTRGTLSALQAVTPPNEDYMGIVLNDPDPAANGYYFREGGAWVKGRGFPDTFAEMVLSGGPDAQTGIVDPAVNPSDVEVFWAFVQTENTGPLTLNGRPVLGVDGNPLTEGSWTGTVLFVEDGASYRMLLDVRAMAAAIAAADRAEEEADRAAGYVNDIVAEKEVPIYSTIAGMSAIAVPDGMSTIRVNDSDTLGGGGGGNFIDQDNGTGVVFSTIVGTGATARDWYRVRDVSRLRLGDFERSIARNPFEFGAVGDGVADDTVALNAWAQFGGPLVGVPNTFRVTDTVTFDKPFTLRANGMDIVHDTAERVACVHVDTVDGFIIDGLGVDGRRSLKPASGQSGAHGIRIEGCSNYTVQGCHIRETQEHAISNYSYNGEEPIWIRDAFVLNNNIHDVGNPTTGRGYAIWFFGYIERVTISGNIGENVVSGIGYDESSSPAPATPRISREATITGNLMFANNDAIRFEGSSTGTITGNIAIAARPASVTPVGAYTCGMMVRTIQSTPESGRSITVSGNVIQGPQYGLLLDEVTNVMVTGNTVRLVDEYAQSYSGARVAIQILKATSGIPRDCKRITILGNDVETEDRGVVVQLGGSAPGNVEDVKVASNRVIFIGDTPTGSLGIYFTGAIDSEAENNRVEGFGIGIQLITAGVSTPVLLTGNIVKDCSAQGILVGGGSGGAILLGNFTRDNAGGGVEFSSAANSANNELSGNILLDGLVGGASVTKTVPNRLS